MANLEQGKTAVDQQSTRGRLRRPSQAPLDRAPGQRTGVVAQPDIQLVAHVLDGDAVVVLGFQKSTPTVRAALTRARGARERTTTSMTTTTIVAFARIESSVSSLTERTARPSASIMTVFLPSGHGQSPRRSASSSSSVQVSCLTRLVTICPREPPKKVRRYWRSASRRALWATSSQSRCTARLRCAAEYGPCSRA
jgi:hypothetical protein